MAFDQFLLLGRENLLLRRLSRSEGLRRDVLTNLLTEREINLRRTDSMKTLGILTLAVVSFVAKHLLASEATRKEKEQIV